VTNVEKSNKQFKTRNAKFLRPQKVLYSIS
jgi:hypothetical protein